MRKSEIWYIMSINRKLCQNQHFDWFANELWCQQHSCAPFCPTYAEYTIMIQGKVCWNALFSPEAEDWNGKFKHVFNLGLNHFGVSLLLFNSSGPANDTYQSISWTDYLNQWQHSWRRWCHVALRRQDISSHDIDYIEYAGSYWPALYCVAIFLVSQEVSLNFHRFVGKIVGGEGGEGIYRN